jgi:alkylation response protein AidB-like acyl-CoA dehydrogenase
MTWGGEPIAGKQASHVNLGAAHARSLAMNALLDRHVADTRALARAGGFTIPARIELKLRAGYVADQCREGVNDLMARVGTRTFALDAPLQRYFRDMNTICSHAFLDWEVAREQYGRQRLGLAPNHPLL